MKSIRIGKIRKDGKFPVKIVYQGSPNMFGGFYPSTEYNKLFNLEDIQDYSLYEGDMFFNDSGMSDSLFFSEEDLAKVAVN